MSSDNLRAIPFDSGPYRGLEHNPRVTVLRDVVFGGPEREPSADRRLFLEVQELRHLLALAERSPTQRVVLHHAGIRVRRIQDGTHAVDVLSIIGDAPEPEPFSLAGTR